MRLIWVKRETKNFLHQGWTGHSPNSLSGKSPEPNNNCRPCERGDPNAVSLVIRLAVQRLRVTAGGCGYGSLRAQGRRVESSRVRPHARHLTSPSGFGSPRPSGCARFLILRRRYTLGRNFPIKPILLVGQRAPAGLHPLVTLEGRLAGGGFRKLGAILRVFAEHVRLLHDVLPVGDHVSGRPAFTTRVP
jgi:hypothetical protein